MELQSGQTGPAHGGRVTRVVLTLDFDPADALPARRRLELLLGMAKRKLNCRCSRVHLVPPGGTDDQTDGEA